MTAGCRGAAVAAALLLVTLATPVIVWLLRTPPHEHVDCGAAGPPAVRTAWIADLDPAAFGTAAVCALIGLRADAGARGQRLPDALTGLAAAVVLAAGGWWWAEGRASPIALWALVGYVGCLPAAFYVPLHLARVVRGLQRADNEAAWRAVRALSCWGVLILVPGFVGVVGGWGVDVYC